MVDTGKVVPWSGLRPMMPDMMPVVRAGKQPGIFYNTGHGHLGWTLSAATAQIIAQVVDGWRRPEVPFRVRTQLSQYATRAAR
jgi:D-amino-acid dehydrogenase